MSSLVGMKLGPFRVVEEIDGGGMGVVYRARDDRLDWDVAIKVIRPEFLADESLRSRQQLEAGALARLKHPNVAGFHGLYHENGHDFLVMEYVAGETLADRLARGALSESDLIDLGEQLADGLAAAHEMGVIHRDLKPKNLMITPEGRLKILDFGLAKFTQKTPAIALTEPDTVPGTLPYKAPEELSGAPSDSRSDVYSAGLTLYQAATGSMPFPGLRSHDLLYAILNTPVQPPRARNPRLSKPLNDLILRCVSKKPEMRPTSGAELSQSLRAVRLPDRPRADSGVLKWITISLALGLIVFVGFRVKSCVPQPTAQRTWAVLPLGVASSDSNLVYFAEGVAEELVGELSRMPSIHVISHESSRLCDPKVLSIKRIARDLGAQRLVTGDLRQVHGQVHINVHFVDARNDHELAFQSFKGDAKELLALQTDVRRSVARAVFKLSGQRDKSSFEPRGTTDAAAYEDYLRARYHWSRRPDELPQAIEYFGRAIHADSMYASAWAGLADAWADMGLYGLQPPLQTRIEARAAARRAVQVDDELSTAHSSLAQVLHNYEWDWESAEAEYRHAIDLNPSDADAHHGLAHLLVQLGRRDEAMREIRAAIALNPRSLPTAIAEGSFQYFARNYDSALVVLKRVAQLDTTNVLLHRLSAAVLDRLGRRDEAVGMLVRAVELQRQPALAAGIRQAYAAGGIEGALKLLIAAYLQKRAAGAYEPAEHLAELYARLGQVEDAFHWLEIAFREHDTELNRLKVDPLFDPLRKDPRFADLMKRVGFQEASR